MIRAYIKRLKKPVNKDIHWPNMIYGIPSSSGTGNNKYYLADGSNIYHADARCYHIDNATVKRVDASQISVFANTCDYCTTNNNDFDKLP